MKKKYEYIIISLLTVLSAGVIFFDFRFYRSNRERMILSEQKQLLMMAETVGGSLKNEVESELKKIDYYFIMDEDAGVDDIRTAAGRYITENQELFTGFDLELADDAAPADADIMGKQLAESGWYEMFIGKNVPVREGTAVITFHMDLNEIYRRIVAPVKIGEGGYSVVKDKDLAIIMHHAKSQIGMDAIYDRRVQYPQLDLTSLQEWLDLQLQQDEGFSVIDSYLWDDPDLHPVRRIVAFTTIRIRGEQWIVNSTLPMKELDQPLSDMLVMILTMTGVFFVIAAGVIILFNLNRMNMKAQRKEISYLKEINQGMEVVAKQNDELRHYQRIESLGMMASHIAHEFNNYLTPVMVYAELLEGDPQLSGDSRKMVREIMNSTERAAGLSRELLDFSRQDSGARLGPVSLRSEVLDALAVVRQLTPAKITLKEDITQEDVTVMGRQGMMQHILLNLARNAFQAMEESERKELSVSLKRTDKGAVLTVADTGSGISRDAQSRIFEPFYTTKGSRHGTGLGLSVIRNIMHSVNGTISVESEPGAGTCFTLFFPEYRQNADAGMHAGSRIVCIDNDEALIRSLSRTVKGTPGHEIGYLTDEMTFLSRLQKDPSCCDTVIAGYTLRHMNGIELHEIIRRLNPGIQLILVSDGADTDLQWYLNNRIIDRIIPRSDLEKELMRMTGDQAQKL